MKYLFLLCFLLVGCAKQFYFGQKVKVVGGFYKEACPIGIIKEVEKEYSFATIYNVHLYGVGNNKQKCPLTADIDSNNLELFKTVGVK